MAAVAAASSALAARALYRVAEGSASRADRRGDPTRREISAAELLSWFTVDTPAGLRSEELAKELLGWELVEKAYPDAPPIDPMPVTAADDPRWPNQGYLDPAPDGIDAEFAAGK